MSSFDTKSSNSRSQEVKGHTHKDRVCLRSEREIPWYQLWTYSGVNTTIEIANSEGITEENIGHLSSENSRKYHANRFKEEWVSKEDKTEYSLVVILLRLYKKPLIITTFVFWFCVFLEAVNFHVLSQVLSYVEGENNDQLWAITCAISMAILEFISRGLDMIQNGYLLR